MIMHRRQYGKRAFDIYSIDRNGKEITIKNACYREVDRKLCHYRKRIARCRFMVKYCISLCRHEPIDMGIQQPKILLQEVEKYGCI